MNKISNTNSNCNCNNCNELILIPKYEKYLEYMIEVIFKLPRTEKFNIGNEFKLSMYETIEKILYLQKVEANKRMYYLNLIDTKINCQRIYLRIMYKNRWIDNKKYEVAFSLLLEVGKILGGLVRFYGKDSKK